MGQGRKRNIVQIFIASPFSATRAARISQTSFLSASRRLSPGIFHNRYDTGRWRSKWDTRRRLVGSRVTTRWRNGSMYLCDFTNVFASFRFGVSSPENRPQSCIPEQFSRGLFFSFRIITQTPRDLRLLTATVEREGHRIYSLLRHLSEKSGEIKKNRLRDSGTRKETHLTVLRPL